LRDGNHCKKTYQGPLTISGNTPEQQAGKITFLDRDIPWPAICQEDEFTLEQTWNARKLVNQEQSPGKAGKYMNPEFPESLSRFSQDREHTAK
jgi:hypothetical protein